MQTFQDRTGQTHAIKISPATAENLKERIGFDIYDLESVSVISGSQLQVCELLWIASNSPEPFTEFAGKFSMQTIEDGAHAFLREWCEILPSRFAVPLRNSHAEAIKERHEAIRKATQILSLI